MDEALNIKISLNIGRNHGIKIDIKGSNGIEENFDNPTILLFTYG